MTAQTTTVNKAAFEQGDRPQGSDYVNLIDSFINTVDTTAQSITSTLTVPTLTVSGQITVTTVAATLGNYTTVSANTVTITNKLVIGAAATVDSAGTAAFARLTDLRDAVVTTLTTTQTSAMFQQLSGTIGAASGAYKACMLMQITINTSSYGIPIFRASDFF